ncbi:ribosomal protein S6 kinase delta-1 [Vanessa atalanta]|uniref:ribosomal protein S6 kinase delta-1 n=1 Tax=Vanessa atalanta TaxID=42275 RepID=UPI001FCE00F1|nr:ribosomal protein S6 kinase delta-1 [Vanessa atalanta]
MSVRDKWVRRFSIDETAKHKNGFTIYKITSVLFPLESPEAVTIISVWKRYSDIQQLHKSMKSLHSGLHLKGTFPQLAKSSFFKRFHPEVIDERAKTIKALLEFVAEHRLLFTSTDFVNFLQTGYPEPDPKPSGVINAIRSSLHLPIEETPPLEYQTSEDEARSPTTRTETANNAVPATPTDIDVSQIPIYEAADVEIRESPETSPKLSESDSFESINSIESLDSELFEELGKLTVERGAPDLISFDAPSRSDAPGASETEAQLCERRGDFPRAFECYKALVGDMLRAVRAETDQQTRVLMKEKINKYLSHAEALYKNHLCNDDLDPPAPPAPTTPPAPPPAPAAPADAGAAPSSRGACGARGAHAALPLHVLRAARSELGAYRVLARRARVLLVLHHQQQHCRAMKVIQKIPKNLTELDDYFHQRSNETRQPILPTLIPYMVPLHAYVETDDLIFLILSYAPGERLFDYIKNYRNSSPSTRELNLENVFPEQNKRSEDVDVQNDNIDSVDDIINKSDVYDDVNENIEGRDVLDNVDVSVNELVKNSQKLLLNVDRVLTEVPNISSVRKEELKGEVEEEKRTKMERETEKITIQSNISQPKSEIPPSAVCRWGAEILTALESLHNCGVIWRDLRPRNVLLGARGHVLLSYCVAYADSDVTLADLARSGEKDCVFVAPELLQLGHDPTDVACDFWSFGVIMYELLCGYPPPPRGAAQPAPRPPRALPTDARELLAQLLTYDPAERLGSGKDGIEEIKQHPYFRHIDWQEVYDSWIVPD